MHPLRRLRCLPLGCRTRRTKAWHGWGHSGSRASKCGAARTGTSGRFHRRSRYGTRERWTVEDLRGGGIIGSHPFSPFLGRTLRSYCSTHSVHDTHALIYLSTYSHTTHMHTHARAHTHHALFRFLPYGNRRRWRTTRRHERRTEWWRCAIFQQSGKTGGGVTVAVYGARWWEYALWLIRCIRCTRCIQCILHSAAASLTTKTTSHEGVL